MQDVNRASKAPSALHLTGSQKHVYTILNPEELCNAKNTIQQMFVTDSTQYGLLVEKKELLLYGRKPNEG